MESYNTITQNNQYINYYPVQADYTHLLDQRCELEWVVMEQISIRIAVSLKR